MRQINGESINAYVYDVRLGYDDVCDQLLHGYAHDCVRPSLNARDCDCDVGHCGYVYVHVSFQYANVNVDVFL